MQQKRFNLEIELQTWGTIHDATVNTNRFL